MRRRNLRYVLLTTALAMFSVAPARSDDWPEQRGPNRDGMSREKGLPEKWSVSGEGLAWKAPYGGRSSPIVLGDHVYILNTYTKDDVVQERLVCLNADTGALLWEQRFNVYQSDVPMHRIAWSSPAGDPQTGNVYVFTGGGTLLAFSREGKKLWDRSINQDFNLFTTHGGRTVSPVVDGDLVIVASASSSWGTDSARQHRFMAFDKRTGECAWIASPGTRPYDTTYSSPIIANVDGTRMLISGSGDGGLHAMKVNTGEVLWSYIIAKRGINTNPVIIDNRYAVLTHSEENLDSTDMGLIAAIDATARGKIGPEQVKWSMKGYQTGYSSPLVDGDRLYALDNGANLFALDAHTGKQLWKKNFGSLMKASPVVADGKMYFGSENGKFFIVRPKGDGADVLSEVELPISNQGLNTERVPEPVFAGAAVARGRVYFASSDTLWAIGPKKSNAAQSVPAAKPAAVQAGAPAWLQVFPTELTLSPGQKVQLRARLYDAKGNFIREEPTANWTVEGLKGTVANGALTIAADATAQAGLIKATAGSVTGTGRARVIPNLPWNETFETYSDNFVPPQWSGAVAGRYQVATLENQKVLAKLPNETLFKRMRIFLGPQTWSNYTVEADVRATEKRRQMGDVGITAQTYSLVIFGNSQKMEVWSWQENTKRASVVPFQWKAETWYRLKLRVQNEGATGVRIQAKAWKTGDPEPAEWMVNKVDPIGNRNGSPGLFADAQFGAYFDNLKVTANQ